MSRLGTRRSLSLAALFCSTPAFAGQVWKVDDSGGTDFTTIQSAVDAATAGDVIVVQSGSYPSFAVQAKPLSIVAGAEAQVFVQGNIELSGLPAGSTSVLRGLRTGLPESHGLSIRSCTGAVRVEECSFVGADTPTDILIAFEFSHGALIEDSADVWLVRSTFRGGNGANAGIFGQPYPGGAGIYAEDSVVASSGGSALGGSGVSSPFDEPYGGAPGRPGVALYASTAWIDGLFAQGGFGGAGGEDFDPFVGEQCGDGGDGGDGIELLDWPYLDVVEPTPSQLVYRDLTVVGGAGGGATCGLGGEPGQAVEQTDAFVTHGVSALQGDAREFWTNSPVQGGNNLRLFSRGDPGDLVLAVLGAPEAPLALPGQPLPVGLGTIWSVVPAGVIGPAGIGQATVPLPAIASAQPATIQAVFATGGGATLELGPVATPVLIP